MRRYNIIIFIIIVTFALHLIVPVVAGITYGYVGFFVAAIIFMPIDGLLALILQTLINKWN